MTVDYIALLAASLGIACGVFFNLKNRYNIEQLFLTFRLATDKPYVSRLILLLKSPYFYHDAGSHFKFIPYDSHIQAIQSTEYAIFQKIRDDFNTIIKELIFHAARLFVIPLILCILLGQALPFIGAATIVVVSVAWIETILVRGPNYIKERHIMLLLNSIYTNARYTTPVTQNHPAKTEDYSQETETPLINPLNYAPHHEDQKISREKRITWEHIWWANDFAFCVLLAVVYCVTNARTVGDYFFGVFQLILLVQIFFVPVWATISICIKLLSQERQQIQ